ncbi:MAG: hypothetical protein IKM18_04215, partial [Clostridia bacterium]|nr:hypothetical protein [Clostridia bacterium]
MKFTNDLRANRFKLIFKKFLGGFSGQSPESRGRPCAKTQGLCPWILLKPFLKKGFKNPKNFT